MTLKLKNTYFIQKTTKPLLDKQQIGRITRQWKKRNTFSLQNSVKNAKPNKNKIVLNVNIKSILRLVGLSNFADIFISKHSNSIKNNRFVVDNEWR